jgi:hypothetical protein
MLAGLHRLTIGRGRGVENRVNPTAPVASWPRRRTWVVAVAATTAILCGIVTTARLTTARVSSPGIVRTTNIAGMPTLYVVHLSQNRQLQLYLDPGAPGFNGIHMTFFDAQGREMAIAGALTMTVSGHTGTTKALPALQEGPGHFYSDFNFAPGAWRLKISATDHEGHMLGTTVNVVL